MWTEIDSVTNYWRFEPIEIFQAGKQLHIFRHEKLIFSRDFESEKQAKEEFFFLARNYQNHLLRNIASIIKGMILI